jgi:hypothetical protein
VEEEAQACPINAKEQKTVRKNILIFYQHHPTRTNQKPHATVAKAAKVF